MAVDGSLSVTFLEDGAQTPEQVAGELATFIGEARSSLDVAIYDCGLTGDVAGTVTAALQAASARGVAIRVGYYSGGHQTPGVAPPTGSSEGFLQQAGVAARPI